MPDNPLDATLSQANKSTVMKAIDTIRTKLPFLIGLKKEERPLSAEAERQGSRLRQPRSGGIGGSIKPVKGKIFVAVLAVMLLAVNALTTQPVAPVTYYFAGTLNDSFGTLPAGTSFCGSLTYNDAQPPNPSPGYPYRGDYLYTSLSITINGVTVTDNGTGVINVYNHDANDPNSYPTDLFHLAPTAISGAFGGLTLDPTGGLQVFLQDLTGTVFNNISIPGPGLSLNNFTPGEPTFIELQSTSGTPSVIARGNLTTLSNTPLTACVRRLGSISGRVINPANAPVAGVEVRVPNREPVLTNNNGEFKIPNITLVPGERLAASFSASAYMNTTRIYMANQGQRITGEVIRLWPRAAMAPLNATLGGQLTFPGGRVSFPPNALVNQQGQPLQGQVGVAFTSLDVRDRIQIRSAPGDFTARMQDNTIRQLESFGVFEIFVADSNGQRASLAPGQRVSVELFNPRERRRTPNVVGLFSFDTNSGLWIEDGNLTLTQRAISYVGTLSSIATNWNADDPLQTTCIKLRILDDNNQPAPLSTRVEAEGVDYNGLSPTAYTDANGYVCLSVKLCSTVRVKAFDKYDSSINSCPVRISTPCHIASASDCGDASLCPLQPQEIILPGGTLFHDLNADDPTKWSEAHNWTNYDGADPTSPYDVWWLDSHVIFGGDGIMRLKLDDTPGPAPTPGPSPRQMEHTSGEYRTNSTYGYGTYEVCLKAASGDGLMTSFFTFTGPNENPSTQHDEIDIEFRGMDTMWMWANFFFNHNAPNLHEKKILLDFDAAKDFHRYKFVWTPNYIKWYVDGVEKHTVTDVADGPLPVTPGKIIVNLWSGNSNSSVWLGTLDSSQLPFYAEYDWIRYKPL